MTTKDDLELDPEDYAAKHYSPAAQDRAKRERADQRIWGYGLDTRRHLRGLLRLRRNTYVYEVEVVFWRIALTFILYRSKL